jgi:hypothetical protein
MLLPSDGSVRIPGHTLVIQNDPGAAVHELLELDRPAHEAMKVHTAGPASLRMSIQYSLRTQSARDTMQSTSDVAERSANTRRRMGHNIAGRLERRGDATAEASPRLVGAACQAEGMATNDEDGEKSFCHIRAATFGAAWDITDSRKVKPRGHGKEWP